MKKLALTLAVASTLCLSNVSAYANTFGFAADTGGTFISQGYEGFNWLGGFGSGSWVNNTLAPLGINGALGAAWSNGGTDLYMNLANSGTFTLNSIDIALSYNPSANLTLTGWLNGNILDTFSSTITNSTEFKTFTLNWSGIDEFRISAAPSSNLQITNISANVPIAAVPEPATYTMLLAGLGLLGYTVRRRKDTTA